MLNIKQSEQDLIRLEVNGWITSNDYQKLNPVLDKKVSEFGQVRILIELKDLDGFTPKAIFEDIREIKYLKNIRKIAIVGDLQWQKTITDLANPVIFNGDVKYFSTEDRKQVLSWLN